MWTWIKRFSSCLMNLAPFIFPVRASGIRENEGITGNHAPFQRTAEYSTNSPNAHALQGRITSDFPAEDHMDVQPILGNEESNNYSGLATTTENQSRFSVATGSSHSFEKAEKTELVMQSGAINSEREVQIARIPSTASKPSKRTPKTATVPSHRLSEQLHQRNSQRAQRKRRQRRKVSLRTVTRSMTAFFRHLNKERVQLEVKFRNIPRIVLTRSMTRQLNVNPIIYGKTFTFSLGRRSGGSRRNKTACSVVANENRRKTRRCPKAVQPGRKKNLPRKHVFVKPARVRRREMIRKEQHLKSLGKKTHRRK